jgi:N-acetylglucosamine-6-sulfatase
MYKKMTRREVLALGGAAASATALGGIRSARAQSRPNFLIVLTDDQPKYTLRRGMPNVVERVVGEGMTFKRGYALCPWCGPARATMLTGLCVHNHGCTDNFTHPPFYDQGLDQDTVATRLQSVGYYTGLFGKYLNEYEIHMPFYVAPGWSRWVAFVHNPNQYEAVRANIDGREVIPGLGPEYETRWMTDKAINFIRSNAGRPWMAWYAPNSPHKVYTPTPESEHLFDDVRPRSVPSVNEEDMSDKPPWMQELPRVDLETARRILEGKLEELRDLDNELARVLWAIFKTGQWSRTYLIFTTDNGYMLGEYRLLHKEQPYEESSCLPFLVRGPRIAPGSVSQAFVSHLDLMPTLCKLAGAPRDGLDGRSLLPLFGGSTPLGWRKRLLVEHPYKGWHMLREGSLAYVERDDGFRDLYDLSTDPYQERNVYYSAAPEEQSRLSTLLNAMKRASGDELRTLEVAEA